MKNKNPLLLPQLREILAAADLEIPQIFYESEHSAVIAESIPALFGAADQSLIRRATISNLMPGTLPKNTPHSHYPDWSRRSNAVVRSVAP